MTRLRYIVDRGVGPKGGRRDTPATFTSVESAKRSAEPKAEWKRSDGTTIRQEVRPGKVLPLDLDMLLPVGSSIDESYEYHERMSTYHGGEMLRLQPGNAPPVLDASWPWLTTDDVARLRQAAVDWIAERQREAARRDKSKRKRRPQRPMAETNLFVLLDVLLKDGKL